jgi:hypothetical protein
MSCDKPPAGWICSRKEGHEGPCAVRPAVGLPNLRASSESAFYMCCATIICVLILAVMTYNIVSLLVKT